MSDDYDDDDQYEMMFHPHPWKRETSREAWEAVKACGWAGKKMKQGYEILYLYGPLTLLEVEHKSAQIDGRKPKGRSESTIIRRLMELHVNGLAGPNGEKRICSIIHKRCVLWDVTCRMPAAQKIVLVRLCPHCGKPIKLPKTKYENAA